MTLSTTRKGNLSIAQYVGKMKALTDDMASAGKKLEDEDLVSYILAGLDSDFDSVISAISARVESISVAELYGQLVFHEQRHELRGKEYVMANAVARGRGSSPPARGGHGAPGRGRGGPRRGRDRNNDPNAPRVECQLCGKKGHTVQRCWKRFDKSFTGEDKSASAAIIGYDVDTNWYADSGATDHITGDLEKLAARDKYLGNDQVHTANGAGMTIAQVGHSVIHTPSRDLSLNNILYVPEANKSLVSIHRFTRDNQVFLELHPWDFLIKDRALRRVLHHGKVEKGFVSADVFRETSVFCHQAISS
jgi:hypothetical protein